MPIPFENEVSEIIRLVKPIQGYLDCEKLVIHHINKQLENGFSVPDIEEYLKKLQKHLDGLVAEHKNMLDCTNYRYAAGFLHLLITTPCWNSWIKTIDA